MKKKEFDEVQKIIKISTKKKNKRECPFYFEKNPNPLESLNAAFHRILLRCKELIET